MPAWYEAHPATVDTLQAVIPSPAATDCVRNHWFADSLLQPVISYIASGTWSHPFVFVSIGSPLLRQTSDHVDRIASAVDQALQINRNPLYRVMIFNRLSSSLKTKTHRGHAGAGRRSDCRRPRVRCHFAGGQDCAHRWRLSAAVVCGYIVRSHYLEVSDDRNYNGACAEITRGQLGMAAGFKLWCI